LSRRPHPYFGLINRLEEAGKAGTGQADRRLPRLTPQQEAGVLWEAFRAAARTATKAQ
jgi:hypothetical protein